ncbi:hypothetical protein Pnap_0414 [Polaromonas naphthalenivorans CJ2]|uniref:Uncharacterized protein n=1 Tax=Polaromonas naphthalenivorans (strain CJ2) TaxID=365044 RepID=A1VJA9_POLNA|nr:hypothetical protein Pnap_0414 [Polaromonas naphthalenivorans CJ2]
MIVVAAWMLDAAACAHMELGAPQASVGALAELHLLLSQRGFRRSCAGVFHTCEERHEPSCTRTSPTVDDIGITSAISPTPAEPDPRVPGPSGHGLERTGRRGRTAGNAAAAGSRPSNRKE